MSERAISNTAVPIFTQESQGNGCSTTHSTTNGGNHIGTSGITEDNPRVRDSDGDERELTKYARDYALRTYRDIFARYDWVRLETSFSQQQQGFEAFSCATCYRAIFEGREPAKVAIAFVFAQAK